MCVITLKIHTRHIDNQIPSDQAIQEATASGRVVETKGMARKLKAMILGAVSSPPIAQFITNGNARELEDRLPVVQRAIVDQPYVDDYFDYEDTEEGAIALIQKVIAAHECGGLKQIKFSSNSKAVVQPIDFCLRADLGQSRTVRILCLRWNLDTDEFVFPLNFPQLDEPFKSGATIPTIRDSLIHFINVSSNCLSAADFLVHSRRRVRRGRY